MNQLNPNSPEEAIQYYFQGTEHANIDLLRKAFDPDCKIYYRGESGELSFFTQSQFHQLVIDNHGKATRKNSLLSIDVSGDIATAKTRSDFDDFYFIDYLTLVKINKTWQIVAKSTTRFEKGAADTGSTFKEEIAIIEEQYWQRLKSKDMPGYASLLHDHFSDWPWGATSPLGSQKEMESFVEATLEKAELTDFQLSELKTYFSGDLAIAYYTIGLTFKDAGSAQTESYRMLHIWKREGDEWRLLAGLQANLQL